MQESINMFCMCQKKEDRAFVELLLPGKHDEAFALAPNELSLEIGYVLADPYEEFMERCNKILSSGTTPIDEKIDMELILDAIEKIDAKGRVTSEEKENNYCNCGGSFDKCDVFNRSKKNHHSK